MTPTPNKILPSSLKKAFHGFIWDSASAELVSVESFNLNLLSAFYGYGIYTSFQAPIAPRWLEAHLNRLLSHAAQIQIQSPANQNLLDTLSPLIAAFSTNPESPNRTTRCRISVYPELSRGYEQLFQTVSSEAMSPVILLQMAELPSNIHQANIEHASIKQAPFRLQTCQIERQLTHLKLTSQANAIYHRQQACQKGYDDVLFVNPDNSLSEASSSAIFLIKDGLEDTQMTIITPDPKQSNCLNSLTKEQLKALSLKLNFELIESLIPLETLSDYSGCFLGNNVKGLTPVAHINDLPINWSNKSKTFFESLKQQWQTFHQFVQIPS